MDDENFLPNGLNKFGNGDKKLISLIDNPEWCITGNQGIGYVDEEEYEDGIKKNTLKPDLIVFYNENFIVFDAKYYVYDYNKEKNIIRKQPGIESITKQYLYELAYKDFIEKTGFKSSKNGFLFPSPENKIENAGSVKLGFLSKLVKENNEIFDDKYDIQLIKLPASMMYDKYLNGSNLKISKLKIKGLNE